MELTLTFRGNGISLPLANKHAVAGLLYRMLSSREDFARMLHRQGYAVGGKQFKLFTFGDLSGAYEIRGKQISYPQGFTLRVRSSDPVFIRCLLISATENRSYQLCGNELQLESFRVTDRQITSNSLRVRMLSPITVHTTTEEGKTHYFSPEEPAFYQAVAANARTKLQTLPKPPEKSAITLASAGPADKMRRVVTTYKGIYINGWRGDFRLEGEPEVLQFLYNTGLGDRNSQGFGMFEILG